MLTQHNQEIRPYQTLFRPGVREGLSTRLGVTQPSAVGADNLCSITLLTYTKYSSFGTTQVTPPHTTESTEHEYCIIHRQTSRSIE